MLDRRAFLKSLGIATTGLMLPRLALGQDAPGTAPAAASDRLGDVLPQRKLGTTGQMVTMLGVGGWHIGRMEEAEAQRVIETALAGGVRFFDSAESYQNGESERRYGKYLTPKYRDDVFLMTKTMARDADTARRHLEGSLQRLNTDRLDLWQIHSLESPDDADGRLANGVLDVVLKAREEGKTRFIGFTGHANPKAHQRMLTSTEALQTVQMPINPLDPSYLSFIDGVLGEAVKRDMGVLAMKTLSNGRFFREIDDGKGGKVRIVPDRASVAEVQHFVWSLPVSVLITGPDDAAMMQEKIDLARSFVAMDEPQRLALIDKIADLAGRQVEYYKRDLG